ncbi:MAG TPA: GNAT family N-acetyltransferase [Propionibacteriaceae bacterium]
MTGPDVRIVHFDLATLEALVSADLSAARTLSGYVLPAMFTDRDWHGLWVMRRDQVRADPVAAGWVTGAIVEAGSEVPVGRAGFHGPPDADGMVEVGYTVLVEHRRRGVARAALQVMLDRAEADEGVRTVRASISPGNVASRSLVESAGFVEVGDQWDDEDGLELVYERPSRS